MAATAKRSARQESPRRFNAFGRIGRALAVPLGSVLLAFAVGAVIVLLTGGNPLLAYQALLFGGFGLFFFRGGPPGPQLFKTPGLLNPLIIGRLPVPPPLPARPFS